MDKEEILRKIKEIEISLKQTTTIINYDFHDKLLDMHKKLWDLLYFKINQEKTFLIK